MRSWYGSLVAILLSAGLVTGCSSGVRVPAGAATGIEPLEVQGGEPGWLVIRVLGHPRDIEYFVNGVRIEPDEEIPWWRDARLRVELQAGFYEVEATYRVRAFAGEKKRYRIRTAKPVGVLPGQETHLVATIHKDWRGVPDEEVATFTVETEAGGDFDDSARRMPAAPRRAETATPRLPTTGQVPVDVSLDHSPEELAAAAAAAEPSRAAGPATPGNARELAAPGIRLSPAHHEDAAPSQPLAGVPDQIVIAGPTSDRGEVVHIRRAAGAAAPNRPDELILRGDAVLAGPGVHAVDDLTPQPAPTAIEAAPDAATPGATPPPAPPTAAASPPDGTALPEAATSAAPPGAELPEHLDVWVLCDPVAATVRLDDREVGTTPLRLRIDPRVDHVLHFVHPGCGEYLRLLAADRWIQEPWVPDDERTVIRVRLDCDND